MPRKVQESCLQWIDGLAADGVHLVKKRYLQYEKAGDQYLRRVVCGLDVNTVDFAVSPPFFEFDDTRQEGGRADGTSQVYYLLKDYMVHRDTVPASVHHIFYFCFASICFRLDFLKEVLHEKNKLRASHFFTHIPVEMKAAATVKYRWNVESDRNDTNIHWPSTAHHNSGKFPNSDGRDEVHKGCHSQWAHSGVGQEAHRLPESF